jgi:hypothetical protein
MMEIGKMEELKVMEYLFIILEVDMKAIGKKI